jgi:hypothetical protein
MLKLPKEGLASGFCNGGSHASRRVAHHLPVVVAFGGRERHVSTYLLQFEQRT